MPNTNVFRDTLTAGIYRIKQLEGKQIRAIQDELGYALGRAKGGSAIEHWRKGNVPGDLAHLAALVRLIVQRTDLGREWVLAILGAADFPFPEQFCNELFGEMGMPTFAAEAKPSAQVPTFSRVYQHFIGREEIIAQIQGWLSTTDGYALIGIDGMGGVGKTALMQEVALREQKVGNRFDSIYWVSVEGQSPQSTDQGLTYDAVLNVLGHHLQIDGFAALTILQQENSLIARLRHHRLLILIDNLDRAPILQAELISRLAPVLGTSRALLTSRTHFQGKLHTITLAGFTLTEALAFIRAEATLHGIEVVGSADTAQLEEIVTATGALPLAMKLVIRHLELLPMDGVLAQLQQVQLAPYTGEPTELGELYTYLFTAIWQALREEDRQLLLILLLFAAGSGCNLDALQQVSRQPLLVTSLKNLRRASMLEVLDGAGANLNQKRYRLHPLTKTFLQQILPDCSPPLIAAWQMGQHNFVGYYRGYLMQWATNYPLLAAEQENLVAALRCVLAKGDAQVFVEEVTTLYPFWEARGDYGHAAEFLELALAIADQTVQWQWLPKLLHQRASLAEKQSDFVGAAALAQRILYLHEADLELAVPDFVLLGTFHLAGRVQTSLGAYEKAEAMLHRALALTEGKVSPESIILQASIGKLYRLRGDFSKATDYLRSGLALALGQSDEESACMFWLNLGSLSGQLGNYTEADVYLKEGLAIARKRGLYARMGRLLHVLGGTAIMRGDLEKGEAYSLDGLAIAQSIGDLDMECVLLQSLGVLAGSRKDLEKSRYYHTEALTLARLMQHRERICGSLTNLARLADHNQNYLQAKIYLSEASTIVETLDSPWSKADVWLGLGRLHLNQGEWEIAQQWLEKGLALGQAIDIPEIEGDAYYWLAQVAKAQHNYQAAQHLGQTALRLYQAMQHADTGEVEAWLAALPSDV